jgi:hypothetical protein
LGTGVGAGVAVTVGGGGRVGSGVGAGVVVTMRRPIWVGSVPAVPSSSQARKRSGTASASAARPSLHRTDISIIDRAIVYHACRLRVVHRLC